MKVLHVISGVAPRAGGTSSVMRGLSAAQGKAGHGVTVCTTNEDVPSGVLDVSTGEPVVANGVETWFHPLDFRPLHYSAAMRQWLTHHLAEFDIAHVHGLYRFPPTFAAWLARRRGVPYIICTHGAIDPFLHGQSSTSLFLKRAWERLFDLRNLNRAGAIHYTSEDEMNRANFLNLRAPAAIVPNGLDWTDFEALPRPGAFRARLRLHPSQPLVLFLSRLNFKKGLDLLIPAFAAVTALVPDAILALVGPDNEGYGAKVRQWCRDHRVEDRVCFVDHVEAKETRQAYVDANVFVLPSYTENFGMTVVEAMACGCPVVVSDQVNIWAAIKEAGAGIVVPLDIQEISEALVRVLNDSYGAARMGAAGRTLAKGSFSWGPIVAQLDHVYEALIRGDRPVTPASAGITGAG